MTEEPRVAVVTGASRGIGRGIALALAELGWSIVVNFRSDERAALEVCQHALARGSARAIAVQADIADLEQGRSLVENATASFGRIDLLVNNAGVAPETRSDILETTLQSWDKVLDTNLRGPFFLTQTVAKRMLDQKAAGTIDDPQIVFITSISSTFASISRPEYCVSKAGLSMVAHLYAARLAAHGIRVYEIRPGLIETDMTRAVRKTYDQKIADGITPIPRWGQPDDVGRAVAAIASGAFPYSTGTVFPIDGGLSLSIL